MMPLFILYFFTRFLNIFSLPIFNDEAIYLHWGQIMTSTPYHFYSLFDGKPPLFLWFLGLVQNVPFDPLLAGRGVSVISGAFTLLGLLKIVQFLKLPPRTQTIIGLLYITNPLLLFFDRMAILDSPVSAIFVWVLYFSLGVSQSTAFSILSPIRLGIIQAAGLWIKGTSQLFLYLPFLVPLLTLMVDKDKKKAKNEFFVFLFSYVITQILFVPIRLQPLYSQFSKREGDFLVPIFEIFKSDVWFSNLQLGFLTLFIYITPFVLYLAVKGYFQLLKENRKIALILLGFLVLPLVFEIFSARYFLSRYYLFIFLPVLLFSAFAFNKTVKGLSLRLFLALFFPIIISLSVIINPLAAFKTICVNNLLKTDLWGYLYGWPSGYGVKEAADWLSAESNKQPIVVVTRADSGNPEDAMSVYLSKNKNIYLAQTNRQLAQEELARLKDVPVYFVSRGEQYLGMKEQLEEIILYRKPEGNEFVGVYRLKILQ